MVRSSELPGELGVCASDISRIAQIVNRAQQQLLYDPDTPDEGWWGGWARMRFTVQVHHRHAYIVTPRDVARIILMDVCQRPTRIRNGFYEFLEYGAGLHPRKKNCANGSVGQDCGCNTPTQGYERDNVVTLADQTVVPATIRIVYTDPSDVGLRVLLQGIDSNGQNVLSTDGTTQQPISGEWLALASPFVDSAYQYRELTGIQKAVTQGPVFFYQVNPTTGEQTLLSSMEPGETTASYRRYLVDGLSARCCDTPCGTVQVDAQCKLDLVPVQSDPDYLLIQNIPALIQECLSIRFSKMESKGAATLQLKCHATAMRLLNGQLDHFLGKTQTAIRVPIFNNDRVRAQPI